MTAEKEIRAALEAGPTPDRVQGMVRSINQYRNGDPKAIAAGSHAQVLYALTDARHDIIALWAFAENTVSELTSLRDENERLRRDAFDIVADWHDKQAALFREMSEDIRSGELGRAKAFASARHHAGSAAALRLNRTNRQRARALIQETSK